MSLPSGLRYALREGAIWLAAVASIFFSIYYFEEIRGWAGRLGSELARSSVQTPQDDALDATSPRLEHRFELAAQTEEDEYGGTGRVVYLRADRNNQFYARAYINGRPIEVLVDTGASHVSLRYEDARRLGLYVDKRDFTHWARTANGRARIAPIRIDRIRLGDIVVRDVEGFVGEPGKKFVSLLGMSFLRRLKSVRIEGRNLKLAN